jgi:AcrR family transcriptional regulator
MMAKRTRNPLEVIHPRIDDIRLMRQSGYEMSQIAKEVGVSTRTLWKYAKIDNLLAHALKTGTQELVLKLEDALYARALGNVIVRKKKTIWIPDGKGGMIIDRVEESEDTVASEISALVFALKNLDNKRWADKREYISKENIAQSIELMKGILEDKAPNTDGENIQPDVQENAEVR